MSLTQSVDTDILDNFQTPKEDTPKLTLTPSEQITSSIPKLDLTPLQQIKKRKDNFKKNMSNSFTDSPKPTPNTSKDENSEEAWDKNRDILEFLGRHESQLRDANVWPPVKYYKMEFSNFLDISDNSRVEVLEKYKDKFLPLMNLVNPKKSLSSVPEDSPPSFLQYFWGKFLVQSTQ